MKVAGEHQSEGDGEEGEGAGEEGGGDGDTGEGDGAAGGGAGHGGGDRGGVGVRELVERFILVMMVGMAVMPVSKARGMEELVGTLKRGSGSKQVLEWHAKLEEIRIRVSIHESPLQ